MLAKNDWEEQLSKFLKRAQGGEQEPIVAEELILFVQELARDEFAKGYVKGAQNVASMIEAPCA